ncbi:MAG TPA: cyclic nucleotide-binding domain-containing protein [Nitrospirae bacterium]|nr:DNA-binding transcriptional dual regulator Crp [bacterium BMS3Abin10]GBE39446.1 DNA-binding transcriptional dual regulator Crp [bacterium BMS3Bbin08]HDH00554.1 cyclic nucleotide-binding domain-containing protein [Nitrospirota bacterium]HDH50579.1 cyclic nucleotide-binding domain-containing protein [Nitrospirota bacterium]HDK81395.1 cyclic nucleotide-binding domain-containing protein [Nitrospirota bacterium]
MDEKLRQLIFQEEEQLGLLQLLSKEEVEQVIPFFKAASYPAGSTLFNEGDPGGFIAFILSGTLEAKTSTEFDRAPLVLGTLKKGSFIGETMFTNAKAPRAATVVVLENAELLILTNEALESIIQQYSQIGVKLLRGLLKITTIRLLKAIEKLGVAF